MFDAAVYSGAPPLHSALGAPAPANIETSAPPAGFDAIVQCDSAVLQSVLATNLAQADASTLRARIPFSAELFPAPFPNAAASRIQGASSTSDLQSELELRLTSPRLTILSTPYSPPYGAVVVPIFSNAPERTPAALLDGPPLEISWNVELNLLHRSPPAEAPQQLRSVRAESRTPLAQGMAVTAMPSFVGMNLDRLQLWIEIDATLTTLSVTVANAQLEALLGSADGHHMLRSALAPFASQPSLRISPLLAIRPSAPGDCAHARLDRATGTRAMHSVRMLANGSQLLTIAIDLGAAR